MAGSQVEQGYKPPLYDRLIDRLPRIFTTRRIIDTIDRAHENCYRKVAPSAVTIFPYQTLYSPRERKNVTIPVGLGSGFVIAADEKTITIATNRHVVEPAFDQYGNEMSYLEVQTSGVIKGKKDMVEPMRYAARSVYTSQDHDLAFIEIDRSQHPELDLKPLRLGNSTRLHAGYEVMPIGSPYGLTNTISFGPVSQDNLVDIPFEKPGGYRQVTDLKPGSSGGAIVRSADKFSRVVGMAVMQVKGDSRTGFMIPVEVIQSEFENYKKEKASQRASVSLAA